MKRLIIGVAGAVLMAVAQVRGQSMNMEQTLSDQAQGMTIAFDGLAFLTGSLGADSFLPPGKVADFSGFQYLRDNDPTALGHNTEFVTIIARNVLSVLSSSQISQMVQRAETQLAPINAYGYGRFPLMAAFRRNLTNAVASGTAGLDWAAVLQASADLYAIDGAISLDRARLFGDILRDLTAGQKAALDGLKALNGIGNWPQDVADPLAGLHLSPDISVGVMTYASEMYSWYAGSVEADVYFCPERQGTYFGSFYLKDAPAMNSPTNYTIDPNLTAYAGNAFLAALTPAQRAWVTNLVTVQKPYLYDLVDARSNISVRLRQLMVTNSIDTNAVLELCRHYGELDGMIVYSYASHFARVGQSLATNQQASLMALRLGLLGTNLLYPSGAYLYSAPIAMPAISDTDSLFAFAVTNRLPVPDSGQTNGYTSVFGEDCDYTLQAPACTNAGGIVHDLRTGRMWQETDGGEMTWEAASAYAAALRIGGYSDWRLPTTHELFGILNHGAFNPAMDTSVFPSTLAEYWWTQDRQVDNTNNIWAANAGGGIGPHPKSETIGAGGVKRFHVRCVRGAPAPSASGLRRHFLDNADGTVTDLDTGLTWQQAESTALSWTGALGYAESLSLGGCTDWRLPNIKELQSLNDETLAAPSLDLRFFPAAHSAPYWSSTTLAGDPGRAWTLDCSHGIASYADKGEAQYVRCVRGGGTSVVVAAGAAPFRLAGGLGFTEGPAADTEGNVYFSAVTADEIYRWSLDGQLTLFRTNSGGANGLAFDSAGNLLACEGDYGRITAIRAATNVTVKTAEFNGLRFNEPNDLWIAPDGGVYFSDPVYFGHAVVQGGEHVYYLAPGMTNAVRVADGLIKPNGLCGTEDGTALYVADWGASTVYRYAVQPDGTLGGQTPFASVRCDGMTLDAAGRLYFCENDVRVFASNGVELERIAIPERPTNVEFGGAQRQFLFVTTEGGSLYAVRMITRGIAGPAAINLPPAISSPSVSPRAPTTSDAAWLTARVTDDSAVASVFLTCGTGTLLAQTNTVFLETMRATETKPWEGDACDNPWTVTWSGASNPFEQRLGSNHGDGNPCGLEYKFGTTNLSDSVITLAGGIDARGQSGVVEFWLWADGLSGDMGWTFQLDAGGGYATRLGELTGTNHGWQVYRYELQPSERVGNLGLRFQFRGGAGDPRIDLDSLSVRVAMAAGSTVAMADDGLHGDGLAGDGAYGAPLPAMPAGVVSYFLTATDDEGAVTYSPAGAPATVHGCRVFAPAADSVGDGIPDWWRARFFGGDGTSTNENSCAQGDADGDHACSLAEYLAGTDPLDSGSVFQITAVTVDSGRWSCPGPVLPAGRMRWNGPQISRKTLSRRQSRRGLRRLRP